MIPTEDPYPQGMDAYSAGKTCEQPVARRFAIFIPVRRWEERNAVEIH